MIIMLLFVGGLCLYVGREWGKIDGSKHIERKILSHIVDSPEYENELVNHFKKAFRDTK